MILQKLADDICIHIAVIYKLSKEKRGELKNYKCYAYFKKRLKVVIKQLEVSFLSIINRKKESMKRDLFLNIWTEINHYLQKKLYG